MKFRGILVLGLCFTGGRSVASGDGTYAAAVDSPQPGKGVDQARLTDPRPVKAAEAILKAFDKYRVVALGEAHGLQEEHDFIQALIRNPAFAAKVNDIIVECGNALYQDTLDRYVAGQDVPLAEVRPVWRDTTQSAVGLWNARIYEQIFTTVREVNLKLPAAKRLRVLAGDPPIDWKKWPTVATPMLSSGNATPTLPRSRTSRC
jgi:hypothetical protein